MPFLPDLFKHLKKNQNYLLDENGADQNSDKKNPQKPAFFDKIRYLRQKICQFLEKIIVKNDIGHEIMILAIWKK